MLSTVESSNVGQRKNTDNLPDGLAGDEGIGSLVVGLQGITEFMSGVGSAVTRYDPLIYPTKNFEEEYDILSQHLIGADSLPLNQLQMNRKLYFIPKTPVVCKIIGSKRIVHFSELDFQSNYLYTIRLKHGPFVWEVVRRYRQFSILHKALGKFVQSILGVSIKEEIGKRNFDQLDIPKLPLPSDLIAGLNQYTIIDRQKALETYLTAVLRHPQFRNHEATLEFIEVSVLSFIAELGPRYKEGLLKKRPLDDLSGRRWWLQIPMLCSFYNIRHQLKWFAAKDSYLCYIRLGSNELGFPMLIDRGFKFTHGFRKTASQGGLKIVNLQRKLYLKSINSKELAEWIEALKRIMNTSRDFISCPRYNSFAPVRKSCLAQWFINGRDYMYAVSEAISQAKEQIFITDWWLSPEIYLRRPSKNNDKTWRLDHLLARKADEGVFVYVLLFKEVTLALSIDSLHSKVALRSRNSHFIKVMRHPDHYAGTLLWSHHEKSVVVDQRIAFVGGIDLCFGRWDDEHYRLVDLAGTNNRKLMSPEELANPSFSRMAVLPGNFFAETLLERAEQPRAHLSQRIPVEKSRRKFSFVRKHDNGGDDVYDDIDYASAARHDKWHFVRQAIKKKQYREGRRDSDEEDVGIEIINEPEGKTISEHLWPGKDYSNSYMSDFIDVKTFYEDQLNRTLQPRMPWHDEAVVVMGDVAQDVARHFIQRWNQAKREKHRENRNYQYLIPKAYPSKPPDDRLFKNLHSVEAQVVRSVGAWSAGTSTVESSIMTACCHLIESSKYYVLIENQFFITSTSQTDTVKNGIGNAIYDRITRAHWNKENFRIYVFLPLLPGFDSKESIQAIQYFTMRSIDTGENSIFKKLRTEGGVEHPEEYISFFAMRNWDILMGKLVSEVIYIHSKLIISDDRHAVVGSANINDRSLLGPRDSELALVLEDNETVPGIMDGNRVQVGKMCSTWRKELFKQALGLTGSADDNWIDIEDPVCQKFYDQFRQVAKSNTEIFWQIFRYVPHDDIRTFAQLKQWQITKHSLSLAETDPPKALLTLRQKIKGYVIELPLYFLHTENYYPQTKTKEGLAPHIMWT